jgi:hypothetical protein
MWEVRLLVIRQYVRDIRRDIGEFKKEMRSQVDKTISFCVLMSGNAENPSSRFYVVENGRRCLTASSDKAEY